VRECSKCRASNPDDAEFCSACGYILAPAGGDRQGTMPPPGTPDRSLQDASAGGEGYYGQPYYQQPPLRVATVNNNGKAIASLVVGILGLTSCPIVASVIALVLGYQARREIAGSGGWQTGDQLAKAGVIIGWVGIVIYVVLFIVILIIAIFASRVPSNYWTMAII